MMVCDPAANSHGIPMDSPRNHDGNETKTAKEKD